ncbi:MAG: CvpA family protein, partial [Pseudomonadota bacterium]
PIDGTLGFLFGLARGFLFVTLVYLLYSTVRVDPDPPAWIAEARFLPLMDRTNAFFIDAARDFAGIEVGAADDRQTVPKKSGGSGTGYDESTRDALDDLIGSN